MGAEMKYKLLGASGLRVSELCLGTMTFGTEVDFGADWKECQKIFGTYVDAGGNFIDTANQYTKGTSERFVGKLVKTNRDRFVVATKYSLNTRAGIQMPEECIARICTNLWKRLKEIGYRLY